MRNAVRVFDNSDVAMVRRSRRCPIDSSDQAAHATGGGNPRQTSGRWRQPQRGSQAARETLAW
ncbi:hypothetical protein SSAG_03355 [Streptomyces sp. Mg1]|nr:hypothetical protein SSAG_03355 [Streptomyces sp. Mg1]